MNKSVKAQDSYARRFLFLWGVLSLVMFCIAAVVTAVLMRVSVVESDYQPVGMYGAYRGSQTGWIYYEWGRNRSRFLVYYPAHTSFVGLPYGKLTTCVRKGAIKTALSSRDVKQSSYQGHQYYLIAVSDQPQGAATAGQIRCDIAFEARRESFTDSVIDVWFLPKIEMAAAPASTVNFSAVVEGGENMQVFGARSTSSSGADLVPDDEAVIKFTDIRRAALRDVGLLLIGAFVALGAAMALEAIRPYIEARAGASRSSSEKT